MTKTKRFLYLTFLAAMALQSAAAEEIRYEGLKLNINDSKGGTQIRLDRPKANKAVIVEQIEAPRRLVIDVPGYKIGVNRSFQVKDSQVFAAARFGVHPDKTRIVLDIKTDLQELPPLRVSGESTKKVTLTIGKEAAKGQKTAKPAATPIELKKISAESIKTNSPKIESASAPTRSEPTPTSEPAVVLAETPTPEPTIEQVIQEELSESIPETPPAPAPTEVPTVEPTVEPTALPTPAPKVVSTPEPKSVTKKEVRQKATLATGKVLNEIDFAFLGDQQSPVLKISLGQRSEFRLAKTDTKFYTIVIPGFGVAGKHLLLPFFPPKDFVGFSVVTAKETLAGLEISIGVDPGLRLTAFAEGNSILVKVP